MALFLKITFKFVVLLSILSFSFLFSSSCTTVERFFWSKSALTGDLKIEKTPTQAEISSFFNFEVSKQHPYLEEDFQKNLDKKTNSKLTANNTTTLLLNRASLKKKLELIQNANHTIYVTTFHLICDSGGLEFTNALIKAANKGVDVRLLTTGGPWEWLYEGKCPELMKKENVKFSHMPYSILPNKEIVQLHDKIIVVDAKYAIIGGQNIGSWFFESDGRDRKFRDTDVYVKGPVVDEIAKRFIFLWRLGKPSDPTLDSYEALITTQEKKARQNKWLGEENYKDWLNLKPPTGLCRFVTQNPDKNNFYVFDAYEWYALHAHKRIVFHTPQLNATGSPQQEKLWKALTQVAQKKQGKLFIITNGPGFTNSEMVSPGIGSLVGFYLLNNLYTSIIDQKHLEIFAYRSWIHSKVYYFDGLAAGVGSFNFDESGLAWTENTLICIDPTLVQETTHMFKNDLRYSFKLDIPQNITERKREALPQKSAD